MTDKTFLTVKDVWQDLPNLGNFERARATIRHRGTGPMAFPELFKLLDHPTINGLLNDSRGLTSDEVKVLVQFNREARVFGNFLG